MSMLQRLMSRAMPAKAVTPPAQQPGGQAPAPTAPQATTQPAPTAPLSALDLYAQLGQNTPSPGAAAPQFALPQEALSKASGTLDFTKTIPPEVQARLAQGDLSALGEAFNAVGRSAYEHAMTHSTGLTGAFLNERLAFEATQVDSRIGAQLTTQSLNLTDLHPAARSIFQDTVSNLRREYPGATVAEYEQAAKEMLADLGSQLNPGPAQEAAAQQAAAKAAEVDYDTLAGYAPADTTSS